VASGPSAWAISRYGTGAYVHSGTGSTTWFYTEVTAS
jgi:hypothetical protein